MKHKPHPSTSFGGGGGDLDHRSQSTSSWTVSRILSTEKTPALAGFRLLKTTKSRRRQTLYVSLSAYTYKGLYQRRGETIEEQESHSIFVYTDGSGIDNNIGAAAVLPLTRCTKMAHMRNNETSTVYAAELQGINLALQIQDEDTEKRSKKNREVIFTDNQAAIRTFQTPTSRSSAYIVTKVIPLTDKLLAPKYIIHYRKVLPVRVLIWFTIAPCKGSSP